MTDTLLSRLRSTVLDAATDPSLTPESQHYAILVLAVIDEESSIPVQYLARIVGKELA